jgi:hypothetical protein
MWHRLGVPHDIMNAGSQDPAVQAARLKYMNYYAAYEGEVYMGRALKWMDGKSTEQVLAGLAKATRGGPTALATLYLSVERDASYREMAKFVRDNCRQSCTVSEKDMRGLFEKHAPYKQFDARAEILRRLGEPSLINTMFGDPSLQATDHMARLLVPTKAPEEPSRQWFSHAEQLAALYGWRHPDSNYGQMRDFILKHCKECNKTTDYRELHGRYKDGKVDTSAHWFRFNLNDRAYLTRIRPETLQLAVIKKENSAITHDEAVAKMQDDFLLIDSWRRKPSRVAAQNRAILVGLQHAASREVEKVKRDMGYPYRHKAHSLARVLGAEGNSAEGAASFVGTLLNGGQRLSLSRFDRLQFGQDASNPHFTTITTNGRDGDRAIHPRVAWHSLQMAQSALGPGGTFRLLDGVFKYPNGTPMEVSCKTGTNGESTDANARRANNTYMRGAFGACTFGPNLAIVMQVQLEDATARDRFTSGTVVRTFKAEAASIQELINRTYRVPPSPGAAQRVPPLPAKSESSRPALTN